MTQPKIDGVGHGVPRMLYASDGSNWYAILVDSDGHVKVDIVAYPGSNALGNFPFGYYDRYFENIDWTMAAATENKNTTAVPAGEIWVLTCAAIRNITGAATTFTVMLIGTAGNGPYITWGKDIVQYQPIYWNGSVVLEEGDKVNFAVSGGAAAENIEARVWGYKMKIA